MGAFWLSHHTADEWNRTYLVRGVRLCARCLGTYPVMFAAIAAQFLLNAPLVWEHDGLWCVGWLLPGLLDWAFGRFRPERFGNDWRLLTGAGIGLALGRTLYVHIQQPLPLWLQVQVGLVTAVSVPVILASLRRGRRH